MHYLSGQLFHQNKFSAKFIGPNLFFPWLLVFYYQTDAFVFVPFMSSKSHPHPICRSSRSKMFFKFLRKAPGLESLFNKVAGLKVQNFIKKGLQYKCFPVKFAKFYRKPPVAASISVAFPECFFFYFSLATLPLLPYSTVTFFV